MSERRTSMCPFCEKKCVEVLYTPPRVDRVATRGSGKNGTTLVRTAEKYEVLADCPNCGKPKKDIEKVLREGESRSVDHQAMMERLKKAGLPTRV